MKITDIFKDEERTFSFEFFPPKDEISAVEMGINLGHLKKLNPSFVSVTYGAGGTTQERTFKLVDFIQNKLEITTMAHYTCVNASEEKVKKDLDELYKINIENLMLLRGDPPKGATNFIPSDEHFRYGSDLVAFAAKQNRFCIGAGAYPEKHVEASNMAQDIDNLKKKVNAGAEFLITQMFFDNNYYYEFIERAQKAGISCRIIPGLIPINNFKQIKKFADLSGAKIPGEIVKKLQPYQNDPGKVSEIGVEIAINQAKDLLAKGAPGLHIYTLNKSRAAAQIYESLSNDFGDIKHRYENSFTPHI
jgi:methylenetetrahydrofolate reductase (NADPH)